MENMRVCGLAIKKQERKTLQGYNGSLVIPVLMGGKGYFGGSLNSQILSVII